MGPTPSTHVKAWLQRRKPGEWYGTQARDYACEHILKFGSMEKKSQQNMNTHPCAMAMIKTTK